MKPGIAPIVDFRELFVKKMSLAFLASNSSGSINPTEDGNAQRYN